MRGFRKPSSERVRTEYNRIMSEILRMEKEKTVLKFAEYHTSLTNQLKDLDREDSSERN